MKNLSIRRIAACLAGLALSACGSGRDAAQPPTGPGGLAGALALIKAEEARLSTEGNRQALALPQEKFGDQAWLAGPEGTYTIGANSLTISSGSASLGNFNYLSYGVYRYTGNTGENPVFFFLSTAPDPLAQYTLYAVTYGFDPQWTELGSFVGDPGNNGIPLVLPADTVSANGNVYIAVVVVNQFTLTITSSRVSEFYEKENNDGTGEANQIPVIPGAPGFEITGQIGSGDPGGDRDGDDQDWYYLNAESGGVALFTFDYTNSTGQVDAYLYAADGTTLLDSGNVDSANEYIVETLPAAGLYFLKLECTSGYASYSYRAWFDGGSFGETEDNDAFGAANPLSGSPEFGYLSGDIGAAGGNDGDSEDWFSFNGASQSLAQLKLYADDKAAVPQIELFSSDGSTLLVTGAEENEYFVAERGVTPAAFYVKVSTAGDSTAYVLGGLLAGRNLLGVGLDEVEDNDILLLANALPAFPVSGWLGNLGVNPDGGSYDGDRVDWVSFSAANGDTVDLTATADFDKGDFSLYLYDLTETELASSVTQGSSENINYAITADGTYYFKLVGLYGFSDYSLDGTLTP